MGSCFGLEGSDGGRQIHTAIPWSGGWGCRPAPAQPLPTLLCLLVAGPRAPSHEVHKAGPALSSRTAQPSTRQAMPRDRGSQGRGCWGRELEAAVAEAGASCDGHLLLLAPGKAAPGVSWAQSPIPVCPVACPVFHPLYSALLSSLGHTKLQGSWHLFHAQCGHLTGQAQGTMVQVTRCSASGPSILHATGDLTVARYGELPRPLLTESPPTC